MLSSEGMQRSDFVAQGSHKVRDGSHATLKIDKGGRGGGEVWG